MSSPAPDKATEQEVRRLLKRLARAKDDWPSEPALRNLSPQMAEALLKHMEQQGKLNKCVFTVALMLLILFEYFNYNGLYPDYSGAAIVGLLIGCIMMGGMEPNKRYIVYALTQTSDLRVLPTLLNATYNDWGRHPQVLCAICRLLTQVTEADAGLLSLQMQKRVWRLALMPIPLHWEYDEALAANTLQALAHIGSREMLSRMQRFVRGPAAKAHPQCINALIEQLIPIMEERLQRQEVPQTLLRASGASTSTPDTLLRAAHATTTEPTAQLLRVSLSETSADMEQTAP